MGAPWFYHQFAGRPDRHCESCGLPDRALIHVKPHVFQSEGSWFARYGRQGRIGRRGFRFEDAIPPLDFEPAVLLWIVDRATDLLPSRVAAAA